MQTPSIVLGGVERPLPDMPTALLITLLFKSNGPDVVSIARELRTRKNERSTGGNWHGRILAQLNRVDPPPCACGGKGLYIVGSTTYCRKCKLIAKAHRLSRAEQLNEHSAALGAEIDAAERGRLNRQKWHRSFTRTRRPK